MPIKMPKKTLKAEDFIAGATATPKAKDSVVRDDLPWLDPRVRDDLRVQVNVKLPERLMIQRDWLSARLGLKKQEIIEVALRIWIENELTRLGIEKES